MKGARVLVALAAALPIFYFSNWVELTSVDQPPRVEPGAVFDATIQGVIHPGGPWYLEYTDSAGDPGSSPPGAVIPPIEGPPDASNVVRLRLGVLVPADWKTVSASYSVKDFSPPPVPLEAPAPPEWGGSLAPADEEAWVYEAYHPAPTGYQWRAFGGVEVDAGWQTQIRFHVRVQAGAVEGGYHLVYGTWSQPPYWYLDGATYPPADSLLPVPPPSFVGADVIVGEVGPPPVVVAFSPPDGAADVPVDTDIRVVFDRDMDLSTLRDGGIQLYSGPVYYPAGSTRETDGPAWRHDSPLDPLFSVPPWEPWPIPVQIFWNAAAQTAVVDPLMPLAGHTVHTVLVTWRARALDGAALAEHRAAAFMTERVPSPPFFWDVPPGHRFRAAIEELFAAGILTGFPDHTFRPDDPVTRGQLATMLVRLLGLHTPEPDAPPPFHDVPAPAQDAAADYVAEAARAGIVAGFDDGSFRSQDPVTRIQMTRMIVRATQDYLAAPPPDFSAGFADVDSVDRGFVDWAVFNGLADGKEPGRFDPWSTATRGHAARLLYGAWNLVPRPLAR